MDESFNYASHSLANITENKIFPESIFFFSYLKNAKGYFHIFPEFNTKWRSPTDIYSLII